MIAARRAEVLGARLPPLLVAAQHVASTVAQGVHGRRRVGQGDSFWQYRPFTDGDAITRIDGRASAKSDRAYVRETEWEAAQTVLLWCDNSPGMAWRSRDALPTKRERAAVLTLALASLLIRGGERVRLLGGTTRIPGGRAALDHLAAGLDGALPGLPARTPVPRHAQLVLVGDFLDPLDDLRRTVETLAAAPARGHLLQVLDPAEAELPFRGRIRFRGLEKEADTLVPSVEGVREGYVAALAAQQDGLRALCTTAGWRFGVHRTDNTAEAALLALYTALAP